MVSYEPAKNGAEMPAELEPTQFQCPQEIVSDLTSGRRVSKRVSEATANHDEHSESWGVVADRHKRPLRPIRFAG